MRINLSAPRGDQELHVVKSGDVLVINGVEYDFTQIPEGATLPAEAIDCAFILGPVERAGGQLLITLIAPHDADAPEAARFPEPIIDPADGVLELPQ